MALKPPSQPLLSRSRRIQLSQQHAISHPCIQQTRNATLLKRPKRPYTFTQLVTLADGSAYMHRTTSPLAVYRSVKDARNAPMWNPSSSKLLNVEDDYAGKLKRFRDKFGSAYDAQTAETEGNTDNAQNQKDGLLDLLSAAASQDPSLGKRGPEQVVKTKGIAKKKK